MNMNISVKIKYLLVFAALLALISCPKQVVEEIEKKEPVYLLPEPERVFFYRDGTTVYEAKIPVNAVIGNSFILPQAADKNSFTIYQNGSRLFLYSLEDARLLVQTLEKDPYNPEIFLVRPREVLLVTVPELEPDYPLDVRFGIGRSGITWEMVLDMEVKEGNKLDTNLLASIETRSHLDETLQLILAKRPEIILLSSTNIFLEGSDAVFNLGNPLIEAGKTTFMRLEGGQSSYRLVYFWDAHENDQPSALLYCTNPFTSSLNRVRGNLNSNGLNINSFSSIRLTPGRHFELYVGSQPLITTSKSVRTQEFPEDEFPARKNLPYTHHLQYTVNNKLPERVEFEISVPVIFGQVYRNQYRFQRQPDERPGDRMIWKYMLAPGAAANVEFQIDSESKENPLFSKFDNYEGGGR
ncbi:MAG: hypothetical protein LBH44_04940 [Treponema sp.]|jgi:hypothetical protein|nr:hypothetical protein [Treponema sp.]